MPEKIIQGFSTIGTAIDKGGKVVARDLFVGIDTTIYSISVGTPDYIADIRQQNERIVDPDLKIHDNIFPVPEETIVDFGLVYSTIVKAPMEILRPYLREQVLDEDSSSPQD